MPRAISRSVLYARNDFVLVRCCAVLAESDGSVDVCTNIEAFPPTPVQSGLGLLDILTLQHPEL